jgi:signal transduction histidine kinase
MRRHEPGRSFRFGGLLKTDERGQRPEPEVGDLGPRTIVASRGDFRLNAESATTAEAAPERTGGLTKRGVAWAAVTVAASAVMVGMPSPMYLHASGARAAVETLIATAAIASATLLFMNFREGHQRSDLLLFTALATVGVIDFVFSALPALLDSEVFGFGTGPQAACHALAAVAFGVAALSPSRTVERSGTRWLRIAGAVVVSTIAIAFLIDYLLGHPRLDSSSTGITAAAAHPVLLIEEVLASAILLLAGAAFLSRPERDARLFGGASLLLAVARLQYLALPAMAPDWLTPREGFRLVAYALLLVAAASRYARTRRALAAATLAVERERIARDLHDGLAQDLAFIALQGQQLSSELGAEHPLTVAARHAVAASRDVMVNLSASDAASTETALRQVADELTARFGIDVDVDVRIQENPDSVQDDLDPVRREEVVRIAREAIVNAARHGDARHVTLALDRMSEDQIRLRIRDDGHGMAETKRRGGYGMQMMRARAAGLGGRLATLQTPEGGVEIEVTFPSEAAVTG